MDPADAVRNLPDEAIAAPVRRLDVARRSGVIAQGLAQLSDTVFQYRIADERGRPDGVEQLLLGDQLSAVLHEVS